MSPISHITGYLLHLKFIGEPLQYILPLNSFNFYGSILLDELIDVHESAAHAHLDLISLFDFYVDAFLAKVVYTF